ncbi:MAG: acetolactate synthase small subunit [Polyangiaceae bacterium]|nr:acetolactate synthase small subunit [Polyangiaceae bacterium]
MHRTFIAYVEDLPGVLARVVSLFRRRVYNIDTLTVGRTHRAGISRLTVVIEADDDEARRVEANLYKLVNVLYVEDASRAATVERELVLIKVKAPRAARAEVMALVEVFRAKVVDVSPDGVIVEVTGTGEKIAGLVEVLAPFGISEMVRSGKVAMMRSAADTEAREARLASGEQRVAGRIARAADREDVDG